MRISNEHVARLLEAHLERIQTRGNIRPPSRPGMLQPDAATFSARADDLRAALEAARGGELSDRGQLESLSRSVQREEYRVPSGSVAEAMLREMCL